MMPNPKIKPHLKQEKHRPSSDSNDSEEDSSLQSSSPSHSAPSSNDPEVESFKDFLRHHKMMKDLEQAKRAKQSEKSKKKYKGTTAAFIRVDNLWSKSDHDYVLKKSSEHNEAGKYEEYAFNVRREFDWKNKYTGTFLDIMSKPLKTALRHVMGQVKGISLEEDQPSVDPNTIFLFLEELRAYMGTLRAQRKAEKKQSKAKKIALEARHLGVLINYLDQDYDKTKKTLYPLLENKKITFDLLWAVFKSNEIIYAPTYNAEGEHRAFKLAYVSLDNSILKGDYYTILGHYLEFDGTKFGMGNMQLTVQAFKGPRPISSLPCYPIRYHRDHAKLEPELIERGKQFVALKEKKHYVHTGMAFYKKNNEIVKLNIDGRVMLDEKTFRRINPNYPISTLEPEDMDILRDSKSDDSDKAEDSSSDKEDRNQATQFDDGKEPKIRKKLIQNKETDTVQCVDVPADEEGNVIRAEEIEEIRSQNESGTHGFTDEEYLIASPVALGFSFDEKIWLEFTVRGIRDILWNNGAFDSLVIPEDQKQVIKSLISSHEPNASKNITDIIQGKGQGLVAVLHGPPGTGKTLTAEATAEMLKKPLYMVSVGELGLRMEHLEKNLTQILDIAHTWRAVLLIDEADVFLEQRQNHDLTRNALVSIFLRKLEYFQGILFLTTNRVSTFDEAFQSRIHIGLRYEKLDLKARKKVWKLFIGNVKSLPNVEVADFTEEDIVRLSREEVNGREIKNAVRTAQSIALTESAVLSMKHLLSVLCFSYVFVKNLKGPGYEDALRMYQ